ncbi:MAG: glycosyltransferase [Planctomycetia bacterium]|nr:glycosyltransferase [Planctomycetia bacterium]
MHNRDWISLDHLHGMIVMDHLDRMTDSTGLIQHAIYGVPRRGSGYTTDDNARALRLCTRLWCQHPEDRMLSRVAVYLSFLEHARSTAGAFHNFLDYQRQWLDATGAGDCQGQAVRALAEVLASRLPDDYRMLARELIDAVTPTLADLRSLRAQAYVILAWGQLWASGVKDIDPLEGIALFAARRLAECYHRSVRPNWQWFESRMTYANAVLPHALFAAAQRWPNEGFLEVAETSFHFLDGATTVANVFCPIGNDGWYSHGGDRALYDQQPVEAATMADAALAAFDVLGDGKWLTTFHRAYGWFHRENTLGESLVDVQGGACCDGLQPSGVNRNQGAESTLAYLWTEARNFEVAAAPDEKSKPASASA